MVRRRPGRGGRGRPSRRRGTGWQSNAVPLRSRGDTRSAPAASARSCPGPSRSGRCMRTRSRRSRPRMRTACSATASLRCGRDAGSGRPHRRSIRAGRSRCCCRTSCPSRDLGIV